MKSKKKGHSISYSPLVIKASNSNNDIDAGMFSRMLKNMEALCQLNEFLREKVIILKGEKERLEIVVKENIDVVTPHT
ncbi:hypothetical protein PVK06_027676 [Gossypium arboreum]|uniref:Ty3-gypsy retrotransposon protein n=1 Tax=Gossypium arboreum TaxID=29729 RepID=A0ABR0P0Y2_GOSAR|nr:hypothetical protein PVK06_027676 [Gossypium arboreum]